MYEAVEAMFKGLGLALRRVGTPEWNPPRRSRRARRSGDHRFNLVSSKNMHEKINGPEARRVEHARIAAPPHLDYALRAAGRAGACG